MSDFDMVGQRGTTIGYHLPVAIGDTPINISLPNTVVVFTAKRRRSDAAALIEYTYRAAPAASDPGLTLLSPTSDTLDLEIAAADTQPNATTGDFESTEFLVWDAILTEPSGRETRIGKGALTVSAGVGS